MEMLENKSAEMLYNCDTTIIDRDYNNFTYYSNKTGIKYIDNKDILRMISSLARE